MIFPPLVNLGFWGRVQWEGKVFVFDQQRGLGPVWVEWGLQIQKTTNVCELSIWYCIQIILRFPPVVCLGFGALWNEKLEMFVFEQYRGLGPNGWNGVSKSRRQPSWHKHYVITIHSICRMLVTTLPIMLINVGFLSPCTEKCLVWVWIATGVGRRMGGVGWETQTTTILCRCWHDTVIIS